MFIIKKAAGFLCWAGLMWAALSLLGLEPVGVPGPIQFLKMLIIFILPGGLAVLLGYGLRRWCDRRIKQDEQLREQERDRRAAEDQRLLADFYKDEAKPHASGFPSPDADARSEVPEDQAAPPDIIEGVCRSCGARKTLRAGRPAECDYCGAVIRAD